MLASMAATWMPKHAKTQHHESRSGSPTPVRAAASGTRVPPAQWTSAKRCAANARRYVSATAGTRHAAPGFASPRNCFHAGALSGAAAGAAGTEVVAPATVSATPRPSATTSAYGGGRGLGEKEDLDRDASTRAEEARSRGEETCGTRAPRRRGRARERQVRLELAAVLALVQEPRPEAAQVPQGAREVREARELANAEQVVGVRPEIVVHRLHLDPRAELGLGELQRQHVLEIRVVAAAGHVFGLAFVLPAAEDHVHVVLRQEIGRSQITAFDILDRQNVERLRHRRVDPADVDVASVIAVVCNPLRAVRRGHADATALRNADSLCTKTWPLEFVQSSVTYYCHCLPSRGARLSDAA
mmetsp:Transcript_5361/g.15856  ORF Transcript_5361/g.15856 Transcript_5361/m.15856 type:complete len:358 (-) Transcript_5361:82-1155(-)